MSIAEAIGRLQRASDGASAASHAVGQALRHARQTSLVATASVEAAAVASKAASLAMLRAEEARAAVEREIAKLMDAKIVLAMAAEEATLAAAS